MLEDGAYNRLLDQYYINEQPLPLDNAMIYRMSRAKSKQEKAAVNFVLSAFFEKRADGYHQKRADEEILAYQERAKTARENGAKGGRKANPERTQRVPVGIAKPNPEETERETSRKPVTSNQEPNTAPRLVTGGEEKPETPAPLEIETHKITPHGAMAVELTKRGVAITSMNPDLLDWIAKGVTIPQACEAVALARQKKPEPERISAGYLNTIIHGEIINPKQKKPSGPAWWTSYEATAKKAQELGLTARPGEENPSFHQRIRDEIERRKRNGGEEAAA